jgi:hypothetical protein
MCAKTRWEVFDRVEPRRITQRVLRLRFRLGQKQRRLAAVATSSLAVQWVGYYGYDKCRLPLMAFLLCLRQRRPVRAQPEMSQPVDHQYDSDLRRPVPACGKWEPALQHEQQHRERQQEIQLTPLGFR